MRIVHSDYRKGEVKVRVDCIDDLWYLSTAIDPGDLISGQTMRKMKFGGDEKQKVERKRVFLKIIAEKVEFEPKMNSLRVLGSITEGPDTVSHGTHHSFDIEPGTSITIAKEEWLDFQRKRIEEAAQQKSMNILIVVHDREEAYLALLKRSGYEIAAVLKGDVAKKAFDKAKGKDFYEEIISAVKELDTKHDFESIIVASPAFWKEDLMKTLKDPELRKKIVLATSSSCDEKAVHEVMKRPEVSMVLRKDRITKEMKFVEELLSEISKTGQAAYGYEEVRSAAEAGAVRSFLITDSRIEESREKGQYSDMEAMMRLVEQNKGEIAIISSSHEGGKKLDGLGGIGAILRYKIR